LYKLLKFFVGSAVHAVHYRLKVASGADRVCVQLGKFDLREAFDAHDKTATSSVVIGVVLGNYYAGRPWQARLFLL